MSSNHFHLLPDAWQNPGDSQLRPVYERAFSEAEELFIVSAFLTEWPEKLRLNAKCKVFLMVVGSDFGTTRRQALEDALAWLPNRFKGNILAFNQGGVSFHPKALLWRQHDGACFFLIGSSNLTRAAFESNVEANVSLKLTARDYERAKSWVLEIEQRSVEVDDSWLRKYREAPVRGGGGDGGSGDGGNDKEPAEAASVFDLALELKTKKQREEFRQHLLDRRARRTAFDANAKNKLIRLVREAASKRTMTQSEKLHFYDELLSLWGNGNSTRMGGGQWVIRGKHADHHELAKSLTAILDAPSGQRDGVVMRERDRLHQLEVSTRHAVLTELLCHFFPKRYPILDAPVRHWRSEVGFDTGTGGTEGERYLRLARAMRAALNEPGPKELDIRDLAELDTLIWFKQKKP